MNLTNPIEWSQETRAQETSMAASLNALMRQTLGAVLSQIMGAIRGKCQKSPMLRGGAASELFWGVLSDIITVYKRRAEYKYTGVDVEERTIRWHGCTGMNARSGAMKHGVVRMSQATETN